MRIRRVLQHLLQFLLVVQLGRRVLVEAIRNVQTALLLEGKHVREEPIRESRDSNPHHQGAAEGAVLHLRSAVKQRVHDVQDG